MTVPALIPLFLGNLKGYEIAIIFVIILLLFGGKKIPELMRGLGKGVHSFRKGMQEAKDEMNRSLDDDAEVPGNADSNGTTMRGKDRG